MPWWRLVVNSDAASLVGLAAAVVCAAVLSHLWVAWWRRRNPDAADDVHGALPDRTWSRRLVMRSLRAIIPPGLLDSWELTITTEPRGGAVPEPTVAALGLISLAGLAGKLTGRRTRG